MAIDIKKLAVTEEKLAYRLVWVGFKDVNFQIRYVSRSTLQAIVESCTVYVFDPKKRGRTPQIDTDRFPQALAATIVKDWKDVTPKSLAALYPVDLTPLSEEERNAPIPFTIDNLVEVMSKANMLEDFLQECATEPSLFKPTEDEGLTKNSLPSPSGA